MDCGLRAAHNPEAAGSSPAAATIKDLKSRDFRSFFCFWREKVGCKKWVKLPTQVLTHSGEKIEQYLRFDLRFAKISLPDELEYLAVRQT